MEVMEFMNSPGDLKQILGAPPVSAAKRLAGIDIERQVSLHWGAF
jgi:hypothetical protein